jgi:hypothetical protein
MTNITVFRTGQSIGRWDWHAENRSPKSPKGRIQFHQRTRQQRGDNPCLKDISGQMGRSLEMFMIYRGGDKQMRYVFGRRDGNPYFQWQVPPPHREAECPMSVASWNGRKRGKSNDNSLFDDSG